MNKPIYTELYPNLFSPITIKNVTFKNRIFAAPQGNFQCTTPDYPGARLTMDYACYYGNKARGGAAAVTTNEARIDPINGCAHNNQWSLMDEDSLRILSQFSDYVKTYGAVLSAELTHCGAWSLPQYMNGADPIGPSACIMPNGNKVIEMTEEDMDRVANCFADAALMAKRGGCDMCMVHGGHGWLLSQFISPVENKRTDKYGGSLENRARFPIMVLDRIRSVVGDDMLIEYRLSAEEYNLPELGGGMHIDEAVEFVKMIEDKIDIVQCSSGTRRNGFARGLIHPTRYFAPGHHIPLAEAMKKAGVKCKVTAIGSIDTPELAEQIIAEGKADFVAACRNFIADPDWVEKARAGRADDIRPCLRCLRCLDISTGRVNTNTNIPEQDFKKSTRHMECAVNPTHGRKWTEHYFPIVPAKKKVVVIGGGAGGMQAALEADHQGYETILIEKTDELGGQMNLGRNVDFKQYLCRYRDWAVRQIEKSGVTVRLNTTATPELVDKEAPDVIIVAIGAEPLIPPIPGIDMDHVVTAIQACRSPEILGRDVVIIGGGMIGLEAAIEVGRARRSQGLEGKHVTLLEMAPMLAADGVFTERLQTIHFAEEVADLHVNTKVVRISDKGVYALDQDGNEQFYPANSVIIAAGMRPKAKERDQFWGHAFDVINVGDCVKPATIQHATRAGYDAILGIATRNVHI